jgi:hypothetical protein
VRLLVLPLLCAVGISLAFGVTLEDAAQAARAQADPADERALPAPAVLVRGAIIARSAPTPDSPALAHLREFRTDFRPTVLYVVASRPGKDGREWLKVALPGRPNGRYGWVTAASLDVQAPSPYEIVVHRRARWLELRRNGTRILRTRIAVGAPGAETPLGSFYVTAAFRPAVSILGAYALETSAYSRLSDWPGGGIVGIHGTNQPHLLGQAVSHGCVRVSNTAIEQLRRYVRPGTPIRIII